MTLDEAVEVVKPINDAILIQIHIERAMAVLTIIAKMRGQTLIAPSLGHECDRAHQIGANRAFEQAADLARDALAIGRGDNQTRNRVMAKRKRHLWTTQDIKAMKTMARYKRPAWHIAKKLKRTENAVRQKAFSIDLSLETRQEAA